MRIKKLNARGFSHDVMIVLFVVLFAIGGVAYLVASHADQCPTTSGPMSGVSDPASSGCTVSGATSYITSATRVPLYRLWNPTLKDNLYTDNKNTAQYAIQNSGYTYAGITGYVFENQVGTSVALNRLYSPTLTDHIYLYDNNALTLFQNRGYVFEGVEGYVMPKPVTGASPLYLLYSPSLTDHILTANSSTEQYLLRNGYRYLGIDGYIFTSLN